LRYDDDDCIRNFGCAEGSAVAKPHLAVGCAQENATGRERHDAGGGADVSVLDNDSAVV